ncbi:MAG: GntR family transcriptional regulator [Chloroflexota bacterium]
MIELMSRENGFSQLSKRLHQQLGQIIAETTAGERIPSEPQLAKDLQVSRATLREAMRTFETQGLIYRKQGVGTFAIHPSRVIQTGLEVLQSIHTLANNIDLEVQMGDYHIGYTNITQAEAETLNLTSDDECLKVSWVMEAEARPVAYLIDVLPLDVLDIEDVQEDFDGSILDILAKQENMELTTSRTEINALAADREIARALGIQRGDVVLFFKAVLYTSEGRAVDYSYSYFLPGYFKFHVVRQIGNSMPMKIKIK